MFLTCLEICACAGAHVIFFSCRWLGRPQTLYFGSLLERGVSASASCGCRTRQSPSHAAAGDDVTANAAFFVFKVTYFFVTCVAVVLTAGVGLRSDTSWQISASSASLSFPFPFLCSVHLHVSALAHMCVCWQTVCVCAAGRSPTLSSGAV